MFNDVTSSGKAGIVAVASLFENPKFRQSEEAKAGTSAANIARLAMATRFTLFRKLLAAPDVPTSLAKLVSSDSDTALAAFTTQQLCHVWRQHEGLEPGHPLQRARAPDRRDAPLHARHTGA